MKALEYAMDEHAAARVAGYFDGIGEHLRLPQHRESFATYAFGILAEGDRKSVEPIAAKASGGDEEAAEQIHNRLLHFLRESPWSDREVRREAARYVVEAMSARGIEVILDVVYDHTAERGPAGPCLSFRGIDNSTYYLLQSDLQTYRDDTGTGNVLRTGHPTVRNLVIDSLRYWVQEMHVDGFRFDLASILSRDLDGFIHLGDASIISELSSDPDFADVRLIAEPWDLATYQLGRSFPGFDWRQWNGRFRDDVRKFVKSDPGQVPAVMRRLYGSDDVFPDTGDDVYRPYQGVSFVDCHDGFCMYDLTAYDAKRNHANGAQNRDGADANNSWNCGWEGDDGAPPQVLSLRKKQVKNFCTLLLLSNATPMFVMGDEFLQTQGEQQPIQPGQRNDLARLGSARCERGHPSFLQVDDRVSSSASDARARAVLARRCALVRRSRAAGSRLRVTQRGLLPRREVAARRGHLRDDRRVLGAAAVHRAGAGPR